MTTPTISDDIILSIPIEDNSDELINLRQHETLVLHSDNEQLPRESTLVRKEVLARLLKASETLVDCRLMILECYRPTWLQRQYFDEYARELARAYPEYTEDQIYYEASKYVSPAAITPPHCTGGAVDLTLCDMEGVELDMGARVNATPLESNNLVYTDAVLPSAEAARNRQLLIDTMSSAGFVNYPYEFWHWSYGDRYWAYALRQKAAKYGVALNSRSPGV